MDAQEGGNEQSGSAMYGVQDGKWCDSVTLEGATKPGIPAYKSRAAVAMFGAMACGKNLSSDSSCLSHQGPDKDAVTIDVGGNTSCVFARGSSSTELYLGQDIGAYQST